MGTSLIASLATYRSISRYVALLLAPKSHSSRREQNASLIARSSSFAYANNGFRSSARWPMSTGLRPCGGAGNPHPLRSMLIDVCLRKHSMALLGAGIPAPLSRYHTIVICKENNINPLPPPQEVPHKNTTYWKMVSYPFIKEGQLSHKNVNCAGTSMFYTTISQKKV